MSERKDRAQKLASVRFVAVLGNHSVTTRCKAPKIGEERSLEVRACAI